MIKELKIKVAIYASIKNTNIYENVPIEQRIKRVYINTKSMWGKETDRILITAFYKIPQIIAETLINELIDKGAIVFNPDSTASTWENFRKELGNKITGQITGKSYEC